MLIAFGEEARRGKIVGLRIEVSLPLEFVPAGHTHPARQLCVALNIQRIDIAHIPAVVGYRRLRTRARRAVLKDTRRVHALVTGLPAGSRREGLPENERTGVETRRAAAIRIIPPRNESDPGVVRCAARVQNRYVRRRQRDRRNDASSWKVRRRNAGSGRADIGLDEIVRAP